MDEQTLVDAARGGDADAVEALVVRYQVRIFNYVRALTANDADADDVAQETFIRAFRSIKQFRGDSSFMTWLYQIATNVARTHLGKRTRQSAVWGRRIEAEEMAHDVASSVDRVEEAVIQRDALDRALSNLSETLRAPLILHDVEGLGYREIAEVLDVPIGTVMSRLFRARQRLRPLLSDLCGGTSGTGIEVTDPTVGSLDVRTVKGIAL